MNITTLKQQLKNPDRVSIFVDGKYCFSLSLEEVITYRLKKAYKLTEADVKRFKKLSADGKLRNRALQWLMNRPHSESEFRDYLYSKKVEPDQIDGLVIEFIQKGYLDNTRFAAWFSDLQQRRGKSDWAIKAELYKKGISRETADKTIMLMGADETVRLQKIIDKKSKLGRYKNDPQKLAKYLTNQGYSWQKVKTLLTIDRDEDNT